MFFVHIYIYISSAIRLPTFIDLLQLSLKIMELEQPSDVHKTGLSSNGHGGSRSSASTATPKSSSSRALGHHSQSFRDLKKGAPKSESAEKKLTWLRSQIIGGNVEFDSPLGKRRLTYADHTASGRSLHYIEDFITNNVLPFYGNTHTNDSQVGHHTTKMVHEAAEYIKMCLGSGPDDAIMFCGSGSTAAIKRLQEVMGVAVPSIVRDRVLKYLANEQRWVVFVGPYEHHSNILSWRQSLAEVVEIGLNEQGLIDMEALRDELESYKHAKRPILGSFSACSNVSGIYSNTRAIARLLHQYEGFACFDFAASGPYVEIDMRSGEIDGYDAVFLSPHKFLGGPGTPGILLMSRILYQIKSFPPSTCGGGTVSYVNNFDDKDTLYLNDIEERENGGTPQIIQTIRAALAFWVKEYIGYQVIEKQEDLFIRRALERLLGNKNILILGNTEAKRQAILSFLIYSTTYNPNGSAAGGEVGKELGLNIWEETGNQRDKPLPGPFVAVLLNDLFGIQARGGCACAAPYGHSLLNISQSVSLAIRSVIEKGYAGVKPGWTRISFPYYTSNEEFEFILAAIEFLAIYGQRFLPLYHLNWKSGAWTIKKQIRKDLKLKEDKDASNFRAPPLASLVEATRIGENDNAEVDGSLPGTVTKFESYLQIAKGIATLLPKFPSQRRLPKEIDAEVLHFRV